MPLTWRRFLNLLIGMPYESVFWNRIRHDDAAEKPPKVDIFAEIDKHRGSAPAQVQRLGTDNILDDISHQRG